MGTIHVPKPTLPMPVARGARAGDWQAPSQAARSIEFASLQQAYWHSGGIARGEVLATRMTATGLGGYVDLARCIVARQLFAFKCYGSFWLPMFQFDPLRLTLREGPLRVLAELHAALDGWSIAHWYVQPEDRLDGCRPLDLLDCDLPGVLAAAQARAAR